MNRDHLLRTRRADWKKLEELVDRMGESRGKKLKADEVSEVSRLFRATSYDLSVVRTRDWGVDLENYLNDLVVRCHNQFYQSRSARRGYFGNFFLRDFPRLLRTNIRYFWIATALFYIPLLAAGTLIAIDPSLAGRILPGSVQIQMEEMYEQARTQGGSTAQAAMAGFYLNNNAGIAFRSFAMGIFFGIGTVYVLVSNGFVIGAVSGYLIARGLALPFTSFVVSHGSFELTALSIAGAGGLILGDSLLRPRQFTRLRSLQTRGIVALQLTLGAGAMLAIAALVEAFWSPSDADPVAKYVIGSVLWLLVALYFVLVGRGQEGDHAAR